MLIRPKSTVCVLQGCCPWPWVVLKDKITVLGPVLGLESLVLALKVWSLVLSLALRLQYKVLHKTIFTSVIGYHAASAQSQTFW